jgi:hypothetical protein
MNCALLIGPKGHGSLARALAREHYNKGDQPWKGGRFVIGIPLSTMFDSTGIFPKPLQQRRVKKTQSRLKPGLSSHDPSGRQKGAAIRQLVGIRSEPPGSIFRLF